MKKEDLDNYDKGKKLLNLIATAKAQKGNLCMIDIIQLKSSASSGSKVMYDIPLQGHFLSEIASKLIVGMGIELDKRIKNLEEEFEEL